MKTCLARLSAGVARILIASASVAAAGQSERVTATIGTNRVCITITGGQRVVQANGLPDHTPGRFPRPGNPNTISAQSYNFNVPLHPQVAASPVSSARWWFGIALNGVPFEPGTAEFWNGERGGAWNYEAKGGFINLGLDENNAHVQPTGAYHYHGLPTGLIARLGGDGRRMLLVGWAADGFPIYTAYGYADPKNTNSPLKKLHASYRIKSGTRPTGPGGKYDGRFTADFEYVAGLGDLDQCNGRFGVTPEFPSGIYHYCLTEEFPYISRLFRGTPDRSFQKRGPGPGAPGGGGGPGRPPMARGHISPSFVGEPGNICPRPVSGRRWFTAGISPPIRGGKSALFPRQFFVDSFAKNVEQEFLGFLNTGG